MKGYDALVFPRECVNTVVLEPQLDAPQRRKDLQLFKGYHESDPRRPNIALDLALAVLKNAASPIKLPSSSTRYAVRRSHGGRAPSHRVSTPSARSQDKWSTLLPTQPGSRHQDLEIERMRLANELALPWTTRRICWG